MRTKRHPASSRTRVRPTLARVRDALFNSLASRFQGARVLDLYAGTGALGIGALRRGAASAVFVENNAALAADLRAQLAAEGIAANAEVKRKDALDAIRDLGAAQQMFDLIFLDPPYGQELIAPTLESVVRAGVLAPDGLIAVEGHWRDQPREVVGLSCRREARHGETRVWYFQVAGGDHR